VGHNSSYRGSGAAKLPWRENWRYWGYSSSSLKRWTVKTTQEGATGPVPVKTITLEIYF